MEDVENETAGRKIYLEDGCPVAKEGEIKATRILIEARNNEEVESERWGKWVRARLPERLLRSH